jgi:hypothetical protein
MGRGGQLGKQIANVHSERRAEPFERAERGVHLAILELLVVARVQLGCLGSLLLGPPQAHPLALEGACEPHL